MKTQTMPYDVAEQLRTPEEVAAYLDAWLEEAPDDAAGIARALRDIARAKGMTVGSQMATTLVIDPALLDRAMHVSGERTKKAVVTKALQEFIACREEKRVVELMGKLEWDDAFAYKAERSRS